jgi:hypothetical protein
MLTRLSGNCKRVFGEKISLRLFWAFPPLPLVLVLGVVVCEFQQIFPNFGRNSCAASGHSSECFLFWPSRASRTCAQCRLQNLVRLRLASAANNRARPPLPNKVYNAKPSPHSRAHTQRFVCYRRRRCVSSLATRKPTVCYAAIRPTRAAAAPISLEPFALSPVSAVVFGLDFR